MAVICGIDESGKGPIIGPLVMCGASIEEKELIKLIQPDVKDSKLLTEEQRQRVFSKITKLVKYKLIVIGPRDIDKAVNKNSPLNLNLLEANATAEIINCLSPDIAIIDSPSKALEKYKNYICNKLSNKNIKIILEHKADMNYKIVSAASIIAKVIRDNEIKKIKGKIKVDFGSGYLTDPITLDFLEKYYEVYPDIFRKSWATYKGLLNKKHQKNLSDF